MKKKLFIRCILGTVLLNLISCTTEIDLSKGFSKDVKLQESLVLPVAKANFTLGDVLSNPSDSSEISFDNDTIFTDSIMDLGHTISSDLERVELDSFVFVLVIKNGIPLKFKFDIIDFSDSLGNQLTLNGFDKNYIVNAPAVNSSGFASTFTETTIKINIGKNLVSEFKKSKKFKYRFAIEGKDANPTIRITKNNIIGIKAGIILKGSFTYTLGTSN